MEKNRQTRTFPKAARLLKSEDFRLNKPTRFQTDCFKVLFSTEGKGRLGVSVSKKVLRNSCQRNRVKRILREAFRLRRPEIGSRDVIFIGLPGLTGKWDQIKTQDLAPVFQRIAPQREAV